MLAPFLAALMLLQQQPVQPSRSPLPPSRPSPASASLTTPPSRDTVGYWQQHVRYEIVATLDEAANVVHARGTLTYVNRSPDTIRELYLHQYLNAFRPNSKWSAADEAEGRVRYQRMRDPDFAYERFTAAPTVDGTPVIVDYPGAPDSTVAHFDLPAPLAPGDSIVVTLAWDARPSTLPRRQGRRGRSYDFAQWYPKVAVYDRGGWQAHALVPAGEFYGEYGEYDVTLVLPDDQVVGSTGVPVSGDPGWERVRRWGSVHTSATAYPSTPVASSALALAAGQKAVRFHARDVHHFAWSTSPDYLYEGGVYTRRAPAPAMSFPVWDTVPVHVLYRPGDEREWGEGMAVNRTLAAIRWLEHVYGPYAYPQMTNLHRLDGGGTEFPMMMMNGSASQGLILHEGGHIFTFGILGNNEWRAGWLDEGLTSFQTAWALGEDRHDRAVGGPPPLARVLFGDSVATARYRAAIGGGRNVPDAGGAGGYRARALRISPADASDVEQVRLDLIGRTEPIGTRADWFNEFGIYNSMIYDRGARMFESLRDVIGEDDFRTFMRGYYARWAHKHVDEAAMRAEAERASGKDLGWFFERWVNRTGLIDYALRSALPRQEANGWVTRARVARLGDYPHPMPLGVRTEDGWTIVRLDTLRYGADSTLEVRTAKRPLDVRLDPLEVTQDWFRPNNVVTDAGWLDSRTARLAFDWPLLDQALADRYVIALAPIAWTGSAGGLTIGGRLRSNYMGLYDRTELGLVSSARVPDATCIAAINFPPPCAFDSPAIARFQAWYTTTNPRLPGTKGRPLIGFSAGVWRLDGITRLDARRSWDASRYLFARSNTITRTVAVSTLSSYERRFQDPLRWSGRSSAELTLGWQLRSPEPTIAIPTQFTLRATGFVGNSWGRASESTPAPERPGSYGRMEAELSTQRRMRAGRFVSFARLYGGAAERAPLERQIFLSAASPVETFGNHLLRPRGSILGSPDARYVPIGGAALRGFDPRAVAGRIVALNAEQSVLLHARGPVRRPLRFYASVFGDVGYLFSKRELPGIDALGDAGVGVAMRGFLFDRDVRVRVDLPVYVSRPALAVNATASDRSTQLRASFSFTDLW